jgi:hypothetical protein
MSHCKVQYVKTPTKIGAPGSAGTLATERTSAIVGKPATACSKSILEMSRTPGMQEIAGRPATGKLSGFFRNYKNISNSRNASNSLDASNSSDASTHQ